MSVRRIKENSLRRMLNMRGEPVTFIRRGRQQFDVETGKLTSEDYEFEVSKALVDIFSTNKRVGPRTSNAQAFGGNYEYAEGNVIFLAEDLPKEVNYFDRVKYDDKVYDFKVNDSQGGVLDLGLKAHGYVG
jgi:hypothetical protein